MTSHTDLLNFIAKKINAEWYLEIGVSNGKNFRGINIKNKRGVDPDPNSAATLKITSNDFWKGYPDAGADLVFIDGLHHAEQVRIDIMNAFYMIDPGAVIVVHDCNPNKKGMTHIPRNTKIWCGDVYKTVSKIKSPKFTMDFDFGCCVIRKQFEDEELEWDKKFITWEAFDADRVNLLNIVSVDEGLKIIDSWT